MNRPCGLFLTLLTASGLVLSVRAQVVNDGATRSLSNVTNTFTGDVIVGTNGAFTLLVSTGEGKLEFEFNSPDNPEFFRLEAR